MDPEGRQPALVSGNGLESRPAFQCGNGRPTTPQTERLWAEPPGGTGRPLSSAIGCAEEQ